MEREIHAENPEVKYEVKDANVPGVIWFQFGIAICIALSLVVAVWLMGYFGKREPGVPASPLLTNADQVPPPPRLQQSPQRDLKTMHAREDSTLNTYGWVDQGRGIARVPIERAMDLLAQKGLPSRANTPPSGQIGYNPYVPPGGAQGFVSPGSRLPGVITTQGRELGGAISGNGTQAVSPESTLESSGASSEAQGVQK